MNKNLIAISIAVLLITVVGLSGCTNNVETIRISGIEVVQTINKPDEEVKLDVSGIDCDITVTKETNLIHVDISGINCVIRVSRTHSFTSDSGGIDSEIVFYD